jgi:hyaluronoglucosaminidase
MNCVAVTRACRILIVALVLFFPARSGRASGIAGDCDGDGRVVVHELVIGLNVALEILPLDACAAIDINRDGRAGIDELTMAIGRALGFRDAALRTTGVIEGFYGPPYTFEQRRELLAFLAAAGLNTYVYAPKNDPLHRERWRDPYPAEFLAHFGDLAELGRDIGVRFVFALSPGLNFDPDAGDTARVVEKLASVAAHGVRDFCLFFDDIAAGSPGADPEVQTDLVIDVRAALRQADAGASLCFISNFYAGTAAQFASDSSPFQPLFPTGSSAYFAAYARIPLDVPILWTGPAVFTDRLTVEEARRMRGLAGRPVVLWDNYPVNDIMTEELFLAPYEGREAGLGAALDGVLLNTMLQPEASKIALWTAGRLFAEGEAYDPDRALAEALELVGGGETAALATLADQFQSHPLVGGRPESARLAALAGEFFSNRTDEARRSLRELFESFARNREELDAQIANRSLLAELNAASEKLSTLGQAGLLALDLIAIREGGGQADPLRMEQTLAMAAAIPWRVGANTPIAPPIARLVGEREATPADVFGDFFDRVLQEVTAP